MSRLPLMLLVLTVTAGLVGHAQATAPKSPARPTTPSTPTAPASRPAPAARATAPARPAAPAPPVPPAAMTDEQKTLYALGLLVQRSLRQFDLSPEDVEILKRGILDATAGRPALDVDEWGPRIQPLADARTERVLTRERASSAAFLAAAAAETGAIKTASGLVYRDITVGSGPSPLASDTVRVGYKGSLVGGVVFDSSYERTEPAIFPLGQVLPCWTEGVQRMKVGGKARLVCPSDLAYGDAGAPATIPGGAALVFEVELFEILPPAAPRSN